jgi:hypothetical protein
VYRVIVFVHVLGAMSFFLFHGASAIVALRIGRQQDPAKLRTLLGLSNDKIAVTGIWASLGMLLLSGLAAGFMGSWWSQGWIWAALGLMIAVTVAMGALGTNYFNQLRQALGLPWFDGKRERAAASPLPAVELARLLRSRRPMYTAVVGFGSMVVFLWLMMFKPF